MNRKFGIVILIVCFGLSSVNAVLADQVTAVQTPVVQDDMVAMDEQVLGQGKMNHDEDLETRQLISEGRDLERSQGVLLGKLKPTMVDYRDSWAGTSRYGDLIALTEDTDSMTVHQELESKSSLLAEKFKLLAELKGEKGSSDYGLLLEKDRQIMQLKEDLARAQSEAMDKDETIKQQEYQISDLQKTSNKRFSFNDQNYSEKDELLQSQADQISRLQGEVFTKEEIIKQQESQIDALQRTSNYVPSSDRSLDLPPIVVNSQVNGQAASGYNNMAGNDDMVKSLTDRLSMAQSEVSAKEQIIKQQENQIAILQRASRDESSSTGLDVNLAPIIVSIPNNHRDAEKIRRIQQEVSAKEEIIREQENQIAQLRRSAENISSSSADMPSSSAGMPTSSESNLNLPPIVVNAGNNQQQADQVVQIRDEVSAKEQIIEEQQNEIAMLKGQLQEMSSKDELARSQADQIATIQGDDNAKEQTIEEQQNQIASLKAQSEDSSSKQEEIKAQADQLAMIQEEVSAQNEIIMHQKSQIAILREEFRKVSSLYTKTLALPSIIVNAPDKQKAAREKIIKSQAKQIAQIQGEALSKEQIIVRQENQIAILKAQSQELASKEKLIKSQAEQINGLSEHFKNKKTVAYANLKTQLADLRNKMKAQELSLKAKNDSIHWLNQVLAVAKNKAKYYKLTSQQDELSMKQVQGEVQGIKDDFARRFKNYDQFEKAIVSLKAQVNLLSLQLSRKQKQMESLYAQLHKNSDKDRVRQLDAQLLLKKQQKLDALKAQQLQDKITEKDQVSQTDAQLLQEKQHQLDLLKSEMMDLSRQKVAQGKQDAQAQQVLRAQLLDKENQIVKMKADIREILQAQADKEIYKRRAAAQVDDRIKLARQLIDLQQQEAALLEEKSNIELDYDGLFDRHVHTLADKISQLLVNHQIQTADLKNQLEQKEDQVSLLKSELEQKIAQEKNENVLADYIQELKEQLHGEEDQIASMKKHLQEGIGTKQEVDSLKIQLAAEQDKADQLKEQLDNKTTQSDQMTGIVDDYQKKLEAKDNAYNEQLAQMLSSQNHQDMLKKQIRLLYTKLRQKQAQIDQIKKDIDDTQEKDLSFSMVQQKTMQDKINEYQGKIDGMQATNVKQLKELSGLRDELALARQQLVGVPSNDEIDFLRTGLNKATVELKQKDEMISQIKTNADQYEKEFNAQSKEFQSLKDQLQDAQEKINHKDEDLKYKDLAIARLKMLSRNSYKDLKDQLRKANVEIRELKDRLNHLKSPVLNGPLEEKLQQALDKINEQGRMISALAQKLQDCGKNVDVSKYIQ